MERKCIIFVRHDGYAIAQLMWFASERYPWEPKSIIRTFEEGKWREYSCCENTPNDDGNHPALCIKVVLDPMAEKFRGYKSMALIVHLMTELEDEDGTIVSQRVDVKSGDLNMLKFFQAWLPEKKLQIPVRRLPHQIPKFRKEGH